MRRHVVGAFVDMRVMRIVFDNEPVKPMLQIALGGRIGVFLNRQAGGCVSDHDGAKSILNACIIDDHTNLARDLVQPLASGSDDNLLIHFRLILVVIKLGTILGNMGNYGHFLMRNK